MFHEHSYQELLNRVELLGSVPVIENGNVEVTPEEMTARIMKGVDADGRPFLAFRCHYRRKTDERCVEIVYDCNHAEFMHLCRLTFCDRSGIRTEEPVREGADEEEVVNKLLEYRKGRYFNVYVYEKEPGVQYITKECGHKGLY